MKYSFKYIVLFFSVITVISCNHTKNENLEKGSNKLESKIDSLKHINENLLLTRSYLFDKALDLEKSCIDSAISIYNTISDTCTGDFWSIESEKRIIFLTQKEKENKGFALSDDFYWLFGDTLELSQQNDKCGEWGGDIERIKIFWKSKILIGFYIKESYNCDSLSREHIYGKTVPNIFKSKEIELTKQQTNILKKTIESLTEYQLNNLNFYGNAGIVNTVQVKGTDGSFKRIYIQDYPSFHWSEFHKLKKEILKKST